MAHDYESILREALELDAVDRAKLIDALALSLAEEAGLDPGLASAQMLSEETTTTLDENLEKSRAIMDARIEAALEKARKNQG
jgi:hypothetical protein